MRGVFVLLAVMLTATAAVAQSVVPVRAIRPEQVLRPSDLSLLEESWPGTIADLALAVGREARVTLYPGRPILPGDLVEPAVVERNQVVPLRFRAGGLAIVTEGRVLTRGRPGELIRVMNVTSRMTVWGTVSADGTIEVTP